MGSGLGISQTGVGISQTGVGISQAGLAGGLGTGMGLGTGIGSPGLQFGGAPMLSGNAHNQPVYKLSKII